MAFLFTQFDSLWKVYLNTILGKIQILKTDFFVSFERKTLMREPYDFGAADNVNERVVFCSDYAIVYV